MTSADCGVRTIVYPSGARHLGHGHSAGRARAIDDRQAFGKARLHALGDQARHDIHQAARRIARKERDRSLGILRSGREGKCQRHQRGGQSNHGCLLQPAILY